MRISPFPKNQSSLYTLALAGCTALNLSTAGQAKGAPIQFSFIGACSGETVVYENQNFVLTTAHCFTEPLAELHSLSLNAQKDFLNQLKVRWITKTPEITGRNSLDGAILVPSEHFFPPKAPSDPPGRRSVPGTVMSWHQVQSSWAAILGVKFLTDKQEPTNLSLDYQFNSLAGLSMNSRYSGYKSELSNPSCYTAGDPFIKGDSGTNLIDKQSLSSIGVFFASNEYNMKVFPLNGGPSLLFQIPRGLSSLVCNN